MEQMCQVGTLWLLVAILLLATDNVQGIEYKHMGCYDENPADLDLPVSNVSVTGELTATSCAEACNIYGHAYSALRVDKCMCGDDYGKHGPDRGCNTTCGPTNDPCGGGGSNDVYYAVDSDPMTRVTREQQVYSSPLTYLEARRSCVKQNGDLAVLGRLSDITSLQFKANQTSGLTSIEIWIGLRRPSYSPSVYSWTDPTSYGMEATGSADTWASAVTFSHDCVAMNVADGKWRPKPCTTSLPFACKQEPVRANTGGSGGNTGGGGSSSNSGSSSSDTTATEDNTNLTSNTAFYVVLPLFLLCYGGSCIFYIVGKSLKHFRRRKRRQEMENRMMEFEPDNKPMSHHPLTTRDVHMGAYPPPPYYGKHTSTSMKAPLMSMEHGPPGDFREANEMKLIPPRSQSGERGRAAKKYKHEEEDEGRKDDENAIDFSKLSIQDIIYIKNLLGERRPPVQTKKKRILIA